MSHPSERLRLLSPRQLCFLKDIFLSFTKRDIPYAWLRNYSSYPEASGYDIDVGIRRSDWLSVARIVTSHGKNHGLELVHIHERDFVIALWFVTADSDFPLHLDFFPDPLSWHGFSYVEESNLFPLTRRYQDFFILRPAHEAMCSMLTSLLWGGFYKAGYHARIVELLNSPEERSVFENEMERAFGPVWHPPFRLDGDLACDKFEILRYVKRLRSALKFKTYRRSVFQAARRSYRHWRGEIRTAFRPPGIVISLTGPDGAGKSTLLAEITRTIGVFFGEQISYHWRPALLPDIGVLLKIRAPSTGERQDNPHGQSAHGRVQSLLRIGYYLGDFLISWFPKIRKPCAKNHLVLFDRYLDDMAIDPKRYRFSLSCRLIELLMRLIPRPDLMFVLTTDVDTLLKRKQEVERTVLLALVERYVNFYGRFSETVFIDAGESTAESALIVSNTVRQYLLQRLEKVSPTIRNIRSQE